MKRLPFILIFLMVFSLSNVGQDNFGLKYIGLSIHPCGVKENAFMLPIKIDKYGYFVINNGGVASYEKFFYKDLFSTKASVALYSDCAARLGGFYHIGIRWKIFKTDKNNLYAGLGPTYIYRRNWAHIDGYVNPHSFKGDDNDEWQYLFLWYGGEIEYKHVLSDKLDFAVTLVPGIHILINFSFGLSYKFL
jgi:hypothetical protein